MFKYLTLVLTLAFCGPALAQTVPPEHVLARYPAQWVAQPPVRQDKLTVVQLLPPGQTPQDYIESIIIERYEEEHQAPKDFVLTRVSASRKSCDGLFASDVDETPINGYKAASVQFTCTKSRRNNKSGLIMVTVMAGRDALHVVSRVWVGPPVASNELVPVPGSTISEWKAFARTVWLCDTRDVQHPCPVPQTPATTAAK